MGEEDVLAGGVLVPGFFSCPVGIDEEVIQRYLEFQERMDKGEVQLGFGF